MWWFGSVVILYCGGFLLNHCCPLAPLGNAVKSLFRLKTEGLLIGSVDLQSACVSAD